MLQGVHSTSSPGRNLCITVAWFPWDFIQSNVCEWGGGGEGM